MAPPARSTWTTHPGTFDPLALSAVWQAPIGRPPENQIPLLPLPSPRCQRLRVHRSPPPNLSTWIVRRRIRRNLSGFPAPLYSTKGSWPWISSSRWIVRSTPSIRCPPRRGGAPLDEGFSTNLQVGQVGENKTRSGRRIGGCGYRGSERRPRQRIRCADGGATSVLAADVICQIG